MGKEYRAKVFKSGNSMALRLPKALGFEEGSEMVLREARLGYALEPVEGPRQKLDVDRFWGKAKGMIYVQSHAKTLNLGLVHGSPNFDPGPARH